MSHDVGQDRLALIRIEGMHSNKSEKEIQKALLSHEGVHEVEVDFPSGQASVLYHRGSVSVEQLMQSIEDAGYKATGVTQNSVPDSPSSGMRITE